MNRPSFAARVFGEPDAVILVATLLLQLALLTPTFPLPFLNQGQGLFHIDHPFHIYQLALGRAMLEHGSLVGYDPFFGGGNLGGVTINASARLPVLISSLMPTSVSTETVYVYYVFMCALLAPLSTASVGVLLRWPVMQSAVAALTGILFWWVGAMRWYHTAGMVAFVCASYTSIAYSVWVFRLTTTRSRRFPYAVVCAAGALGGLGLWLHPLFGVISGTMISAFLLVHYRDLTLRSTLARTGAIGLIALAMNIPWIWAMTRGYSMLSMQQVYQRDFGVEFLRNAVFGIWDRSMGSILNPLTLALALIAAFLVKPEKRREFIAFISSGSAFVLFAAFGAQASIFTYSQPNRFLAPGFLIIGMAASYALTDRQLLLQARWKRGPSMIVIAVVLPIAGILAREIWREVVPGSHGRYGNVPPELTYPPESVVWLESWINEHTSPEGRILFETSLSRKHGGGHIAGYLALRTKREFIGGPYPYSFPENSFWDKYGFGSPLAELTSEKLVVGLDLYNVGWAITHTRELADRLSRLPQAHLAAQYRDISIFSIDRPLSYFSSGEARVAQRQFGRLDVIAKPGSDLIMRYQWVDGIATTPALHIEPISLAPDFPPFIKISKATEHFHIHFDR